MAAGNLIGKNSAVLEITKKIHLTIWILVFVIVTLFAVTIYHNYLLGTSYLDFFPQFSINFVIGATCFLGLLCLYLAMRISGQVIRIVNDYSSRTEKMFSITKDLREELYGDILLEKIMDYALSTTSSEAGSILLLDNDRLFFRIVKGERAPELMGSSIEKGKGIAGFVAETGVALRVPDASNDDRFSPEVDALTGFVTKSVMCAPLKSKSGTIGVLEVMNRKDGHPFRERDEEIITYLAEQAAISLIKTKFYEDQKNYEIHLTDMLLESIDFHIPEKRGHSRRVARYGNIMARGLNMSEEEKKRLYFASLLHDVGFLKIRNDDSFKREEYMKHPAVGYEMIYPINFYADIAPFILHHHERYDGHGYPSKLQGEDIPIESRIIAIAEAFDAMISMTSYRVPVNFNDAVEELRSKSGTQFDQELVEIFVNNIDPQLIKD